MAKKQIVIEVEEAHRGLPQATAEHPDLKGAEHVDELWKYAEEVVYEVKRLVNTIDFKIGDRLEAEEVRNLCAKADWKVVVTRPKG